MKKNRYIYRNLNPAKQECDDDVVRALALALEEDWTTIYSDLCSLGAQLSCMPSDKRCYNVYLTNRGFHRTGISNRKGSRRPTVQQFAVSHRQGTYILQAARRVVTVKDGYFYDTIDCGDKCLYGYWNNPS